MQFLLRTVRSMHPCTMNAFQIQDSRITYPLTKGTTWRSPHLPMSCLTGSLGARVGDVDRSSLGRAEQPSGLPRLRLSIGGGGSGGGGRTCHATYPAAPGVNRAARNTVTTPPTLTGDCGDANCNFAVDIRPRTHSRTEMAHSRVDGACHMPAERESRD